MRCFLQAGGPPKKNENMIRTWKTNLESAKKFAIQLILYPYCSPSEVGTWYPNTL